MASQSTTACSSRAARGGGRRGAAPASRAARRSRPRPARCARGPRRARPSRSARLADLERAPLEQRVDHLEQEERVAADPRQQVGADLPRPVAHAEARLDEAHLLVGSSPRSSMRITPSSTWQHAVVGPRDEEHEDGQRIARVHDLAEDLEARLVGPLHALDHERPAAAPGRSRRAGCARRRGWSCGVRARPRRPPPICRLVASSARRATIGLVASPAAAPPPARAMSAATSSNGSSPSCRWQRARARRSRRRGPPSAPACTRRARARAFGGSSARNVATSAVLPMPISPTTARQTSCPAPAASAHGLVVGRVQVGLLGVAADEIARRRSAPRRAAPRATGSARARRCASSAARRRAAFASSCRLGASPQRKSRRTRR